MTAISRGFGGRRRDDVAEVAEVRGRGSVVGSCLLDLTADALYASPELAEFAGRVSDSGDGRWTSIAALEVGVTAPTLTVALYSRSCHAAWTCSRTSCGRPCARSSAARGKAAGVTAVALQIEIWPDADAVARRGAEHVARQAGAAIAWEDVTIFQVDERVAPACDPDRNLTHLREALGRAATAEVRPMPVEAPDLERAAGEYAGWLPESFGLVHVGLGPDGHTASLVRGDPVLGISDRDVALTGTYQARRRMTLTDPVLERARNVLWLITGADKVDALARLRAGDHSIPAGRISTANAPVIADEAAAGGATR